MLQNGAFFIIYNNNYADFFLSLRTEKTIIKMPVTNTKMPNITNAATTSSPSLGAKTMPSIPKVIATTATKAIMTISVFFSL